MCVLRDDALVLRGELLVPCRRSTTRISPHSASEWSDRHQVRCRLACGELHLAFFSSFTALFPRTFSDTRGTLLPTSTFAFEFGRDANGTFLRLSGQPGVHCLWPIAPRHAREVQSPFLQMDLSISESVHCSAPTLDKKHQEQQSRFLPEEVGSCS
jgi:hypothetical protein